MTLLVLNKWAQIYKLEIGKSIHIFFEKEVGSFIIAGVPVRINTFIHVKLC